MNNLKGFASKVRAQARDAAKNLPSFDDMAATDDYIHSEEYNVTGQRKSNEEDLSKHSKVSESDHSSTWSLIDRRVQNNSLPPSSNSSYTNQEAPSKLQDNMRAAEVQKQEENIPEPPPSLQRKPLVLSVVTAAMEEQQGGESESDVSKDYSDDDSWSDGDEEDPILSMIRKNKRETSKSPLRAKRSERSSSSRAKHKELRNPNRFLEGLDGMETSMEEGLQRNEQVAPAITPAMPATPRELGGWMRTLASNQVNKLLRRQDIKPSSTGMPPLAKGKPQSKSKQEQEEYHSADSKNLLGDHELAQLAKMRHSNKGSISLLMDLVYENRQFAFIFLTLVLAALVYFYSYRQIEEDVM